MRRFALAAALLCGTAHAAPLTPAQLSAIDAAANDTLRLTGVPAASIAIVKDGQVAVTRAYGLAEISPRRPATPAMVFSIGSVSKQFTVALVMLLVQDGKLSLDDKVGKYLPNLTRANDTTLRQLLSHTAGYQDFWPEDYSPLAFRKPTTPQAILANWAQKPLDFEPGTQWQYSNTGYAAAALIAEKAGGAPFFEQLQKRILTPLHMTHAIDYNTYGIPKGGPVGYERYGFGPPRPAPKDQPGWSYGSGELAMPAGDLALWDISLINQTVLTQASYAIMETEAKLKGGAGTGYALGLDVASRGGHKMISHSGEETGFVSENDVFPDDHAAVVVLTNQDASRAASVIATRVATIAFGIPSTLPKDKQAAQVLSLLGQLAGGSIDMKQLNANCQSYFSPSVLADYKASLSKLGPVLGVHELISEPRGGMVFHAYDVTYPAQKIRVTTYALADGRLGQLLVEP